jgi:hypothetical protein
MKRIVEIIAVLLSLAGGHAVAAGPDRPNIIVFYTDDRGYADLSSRILQHGLKHVFPFEHGNVSVANIAPDGKDRPMGVLASDLYHIDACSQAAAAVIERYIAQPFFHYIAYRAPHRVAPK